MVKTAYCWASLRVCFVVFVVLQGCWLAVEILCLLTRFLYLMFLFYWALLALMNLVGLFFLVFLIVFLICLLILSLFAEQWLLVIFVIVRSHQQALCQT
jgi:hypothetical protein